MDIIRVVPNIQCARMDEGQKFYTEFLGFKVAMVTPVMVTLASESNPKVQVSIVAGNPPPGPRHHYITLTIEVEDVAEMHRRAVERGLQMLYPLTKERWGVERFSVADPTGTILNIMSHTGPPGVKSVRKKR